MEPSPSSPAVATEGPAITTRNSASLASMRSGAGSGGESGSGSERPMGSRYKSRPHSLTSQDSGATGFNSSIGPRRTSIFSRMSSTVSNPNGGTLRDTFFGKPRHDPLDESSHNEFNLTVIDEEGLIAKPGVEIIAPRSWFGVWDEKWSTTGKVVISIAVFMVLSTYITTLLAENLSGYSIDTGLVMGSLQTLVLCSIVFVSYHGVHVFQAHPNPIILYKCVVDMLLAVRFLFDPFWLELGIYTAGDRLSCSFLSAVTQALYLSSDCWYFVLIVDMRQSLTNPFTSVEADRKRYMIAVCAVGLFSGWLVWVVKGFHGFADGNYCWTHRGDTTERNFWRINVASWIVFYDWMIVFYLSGFAVLVFGMRRLRSGLKVTLDSRVEMLRNLAISIMSFTGYWTIAFLLYALSFSARQSYPGGVMSPSKTFRSYSYTLAGRGVVDYFVWFMINKPSMMKAHWMRFHAESADKKFSAQLNTSLQRELIFFTIEGMTKAVQLADEELVRTRERSPTQELVLGVEEEEKQEDHDRVSRQSFETPSNAPVQNLTYEEMSQKSRDSISSTASKPRSQTPPAEESIAGGGPKERRSFLSQMGFPRSAETSSTLPGLKSPVGLGPPPPSEYTSEQKIRFTPYKSEAFAELRAACQIKTADFLASFEESTKPSISEGASGAFMFFSGDKRFIVKSMAESECRFLCDIADDYVEYLIKNPWSLITKFYGCFRITLYEKKFYFVVMENLFDVMEEGVTIHHRYDIKGSWVNRSYSRPRRGAKVKCRHCSMHFKYGANKKLLQCPNVVGLHEPNVVLKDNDLRTRMRIGTEAGKELYEHLREDSLFLCSLGIMDYSLLLGVTDIEFLVDPPTNDDRARSNTASSNLMTASMYSVSGSDHQPKTRADTGSSNAISISSTVPSADAPSNIAANDLTLEDLRATVGNTSTTRATGTFSARSFVSSQSSISVAGGTSTHSVPVLAREKKSMRKSERVFGPGFYYIGIIDILQQWNTQKKMERFWKVHMKRCDPNGLSAIDPVRYQRRFEAKLREIIAIPKDVYANRASLFTGGGATAGNASPSSEFATGGRSGFVHIGDAAAAAARDRAVRLSLGVPVEEDDDEDDETLSLEHGAVRNPQPILMRVASHPRSAISGRSDSVNVV